MKKLLYFVILMMLSCFAGTTLMSCIDNDDDNDTIPPITDAEIQARLLLMDGYYGGYLYFVNDSTQKVDSVATDWVISQRDSSIHIPNFPVNVLANGITNVERHDLLANSETTFPLTSKIFFYNHNFENKDIYAFWNVPQDLKKSFSIIDEQGKEHSVEIKFQDQLTSMNYMGYYSTDYAIGYYLKKKIQCYYIISDIIIDNTVNTVNRVLFIYNQN